MQDFVLILSVAAIFIFGYHEMTQLDHFLEQKRQTQDEQVHVSGWSGRKVEKKKRK